MRHFALCALVLLAACDPSYDLQGHDPLDYYTKNPTVNKLETREATFWVPFSGDAIRLEDKEPLRKRIDKINPMAIEEAILIVHPSQVKNDKRHANVTRLLRSVGADVAVGVASAESVKRNEAKLEVRYVVVIPPRCPDWRRSPVTTYSNTQQGNYGCASTYNLGRIVADPHDLVEGSGDSSPDATYTPSTVRTYRNNVGGGAGE